jgi:hypothetical protein
MTRKVKPSLANTWHVLTFRDWRNSPPTVLISNETFASKAKAKVVAREFEKHGPGHARCLRETHYVVQSPKDIEWKTCKASGMSIPYIRRPDLLKHHSTFPAKLAKYLGTRQIAR